MIQDAPDASHAIVLDGREISVSEELAWIV